MVFIYFQACEKYPSCCSQDHIRHVLRALDSDHLPKGRPWSVRAYGFVLGSNPLRNERVNNPPPQVNGPTIAG